MCFGDDIESVRWGDDGVGTANDGGEEMGAITRSNFHIFPVSSSGAPRRGRFGGGKSKA